MTEDSISNMRGSFGGDSSASRDTPCEMVMFQQWFKCQVNFIMIFAMTPRAAIIIALLTLGFVGILCGQLNRKAASGLKFIELSSEDNARLEQQRAVVAAAAKQRYGTTALTRTKRDLPVLQKLIDEKVFDKSQTYELQSLGVAFGDVLANELPLRWVMVTDEYGTDPTLRFRETTVHFNALTMISKRVERDEAVSVSELLRITREEIIRRGK